MPDWIVNGWVGSAPELTRRLSPYINLTSQHILTAEELETALGLKDRVAAFEQACLLNNSNLRSSYPFFANFVEFNSTAAECMFYLIGAIEGTSYGSDFTQKPPKRGVSDIAYVIRHSVIDELATRHGTLALQFMQCLRELILNPGDEGCGNRFYFPPAWVKRAKRGFKRSYAADAGNLKSIARGLATHWASERLFLEECQLIQKHCGWLFDLLLERFGPKATRYFAEHATLDGQGVELAHVKSVEKGLNKLLGYDRTHAPYLKDCILGHLKGGHGFGPVHHHLCQGLQGLARSDIDTRWVLQNFGSSLVVPAY